MPHAPQFVGSTRVSAQYEPAEQNVRPAPQKLWHVEPWHALPAAHAAPHAPQFVGSTRVSAQYVEPASVAHSVRCAPQMFVQLPAPQVSVPVQARPHVPQFALSLPSAAQ